MHAALRYRFAAWIALGAMLFAAASPLFAALLFNGAPETPAQICTFSGIKAAPDQPGMPGSPNGSVKLKHCVFCLGGAWHFPAASPLSAGVPVGPEVTTAVGRTEFPPLDLAALQPLIPRAPPRS